MKLRTTFILLIFTFFTSTAQTISVTDDATGKPVEDVFIYHENKTSVSYTNQRGRADITNFPRGLIFVQHPSYYEKSIAYLGSDLLISITEKIITFNEVVISANKWEQEEESVSQKIMSVNKKTIEFQNPQTSADLLAGTGQVFVQKSQLGGGSPKLRGFAANSVLIVVDGVRMNNAIFRGGNLQNVINIDANALESSEVIFGPGSVIYGSDALGGVMDFHTLTPRWSSENTTSTTANLMTRYSSASNEQTGHVDVSVSKPRFTFLHSTTYTSFDDLKAGKNRSGGYEGAFERKFYAWRINGEDQLITNNDINRQLFSGYDLFNSVSKIKVRTGKNSDLGYGFYYGTTSDIPRYDNLTETINGTDSLVSAEWYYGPQKWQMHNIRFNYYGATRLFDQARITAALQKFEESRNDRAFGDDRLRTRTEKVDMYSLSIDLEKEFKKGDFYYGIDFFYNEVASDGFRKNLETGEVTNTSSRYPDGGSDYASVALYGSYVHELSPLFIMNTGVRFNTISLNGTTKDPEALALGTEKIDISNSSLNGAIGLVYNPTENDKFSYNISTGFRAPNVDDVGKIFELNDDITIVPNAELKPEHTISNELAYQKKNEKFMFNAVVFYSRLFDAIVRGPFTINGSTTLPNGSQVRAQVNTDEAEIYGGSLILQTELSENLALFNSITYTDGKDLSNNQPLRHTTPIFGKISVIFKKNKFKSDAYIEFNGDRPAADIPSSEIDDKPYLFTQNGSPGWVTLNLKTSYQINQSLKVNAGVENLLDKHYRPYSSGISAPGRNVILTFRANI
ncbi:MAG: TonB-dependent receptor [Cyclobacteriaceae bacterium]